MQGKRIFEFLIFFFFYLSSSFVFNARLDFFEIFKFFSSLGFFLILRINEEEKDFVKIPFLILISFFSSIFLFKNSYFLKKFYFLFIFLSLFFKYEKLRQYFNKKFILKDLFYSLLNLYLLFLLYPFKFPFFPEIVSILFGFFIINFLKYFSEKVNFPFEEKLGIMTYSKYFGFYTSIFFIISFYFSSFFIFLSFWNGCNFSFIYAIFLLFFFLKAMFFILLRFISKKEGLSQFLKEEAIFYKNGIFFSFIIQGILKILNLKI